MTPRSRVATAGLWIAILGAVVLVLTPVAYRTGVVPLRAALYYGIAGAAVLGGVATLVSLVGAFLARRQPGAPGFGKALAGVLVGALVFGYPAAQIARARSVPPIHDITTDVADPPAFVALAAALKAAPNGLDYAGASVAEQQKQAYPDIAPLKSKLPPAELFAHAARVAGEMGWEVVAAAPQDGRIEATATTRAFAFKDDVAIRIRPDGAGSVLDMRSMSRLGRSDVGANADRIRAFFAKLQGAGA